MADRSTRPIVVVALGGHAFIRAGAEQTVEEHHHNAAEISRHLMLLVERDYNLVITHGNGPQVGMLLLQNELSRDEAPAFPLDTLVADTAGRLGYLLQQALLNDFRRRKVSRYVTTMISQVIVDRNDPAFANPTKFIGPWLEEKVAKKRAAELDWNVREDPGRGWRRVVPSPRPLKVIQRKMVREASLAGHVVITCGGGGIPVVVDDSGDYRGVEAVIDKDLTASVLARQISAELLVILTAVPKVYTSFGKPDQQALSGVTLAEAEQLMVAGHFPPGSMGPKVEAIVSFLHTDGWRGLITTPDQLGEALAGRGGTHFIGKL